MGAEASLGRRAGTVVRWPVGMGLAFWRYLWRTMPLHRSDEEGSPDRDLPPPLPDGFASERLQLVGAELRDEEERGGERSCDRGLARDVVALDDHDPAADGQVIERGSQ